MHNIAIAFKCENRLEWGMKKVATEIIINIMAYVTCNCWKLLRERIEYVLFSNWNACYCASFDYES